MKSGWELSHALSNVWFHIHTVQLSTDTHARNVDAKLVCCNITTSGARALPDHQTDVGTADRETFQKTPCEKWAMWQSED